MPEWLRPSLPPRPSAGEFVFGSPRLRCFLFALCVALVPVNGNTATPTISPVFTDAQLMTFAKADAAVQALRLRYLDVFLQDKKDGRDSKMTETALQIDMANAIQAAGLTLDTYNRIAHAVATDADLRQRVEKLESPR